MREALTPLRMRPIAVPRVWGGTRIAARFGRAHDEPKVGESWEIADRAGAETTVAEGVWEGRTLREIATEIPHEIYGDGQPEFSGSRFPLLVKFLDCADLLSVQVHPDAAAARALGGEPKTEAWVVLEASPGAELYCGLAPGRDATALRRAVESGGDVRACLRRWDVKPGDCVHVPAGTVHAMGGGLLLAEVQQNSDTTYRLHDWNRSGLDGRPRPLHVPEALRCIREDPAAGVRPPRSIPAAEGVSRDVWIEEGPFSLQRVRIAAGKRWRLGPGCLCVGVLDGAGTFGPAPYASGQWWVLGANACARSIVAQHATELLVAGF